MMRLSNTHRSSCDYFLSQLEHDVNLSAATKYEYVQFLSVIVQNLRDPAKAQAPDRRKYRQLRLRNAKIQRYTSHASVMSFLQQPPLLFRPVTDDETGEPLLRIIDVIEDHHNNDDTITMSKADNDTATALQATASTIQATLDRLGRLVAMLPRSDSTISTASSSVSLASLASATTPTTSLDSSSSDAAAVVATSSLSLSSTSSSSLTAKQKGRLLKDAAELADKKATELARKQALAQIQADKLVRKHDANWQPSVAAAAAKSGDSMQTFRDKFGE